MFPIPCYPPSKKQKKKIHLREREARNVNKRIKWHLRTTNGCGVATVRLSAPIAMASLEDLIPTVNKLQDVTYDAGIDSLDLPILSIIGSQSSGKSSILETIVGKDFLPRGTGIVTRRPLVLQLINIAEDSPLIHSYTNASSSPRESTPETGAAATDELTLEDHLRQQQGYKPEVQNEWGEFLHIPGKRFYNFSDIRREIENETSRIAGKNKGISRLPINLKIYSPRVLNLTLVDLPGITKVPIGDQPTDIEKQIRNLILEYIAKPNCIILAVSPANVDLVNSESLKLARQVDPQGKRTIGVLSKLDLMDNGTNALDILSGKVYPLKLGFVGVVNRSQQDVLQNKSVEEGLESEEEFFRAHPVYRTISNRCGTRYLAKLLNQTLMAHIREKLPDIKARLNTLMGQTEQELASYGGLHATTEEGRGALILQLMTKFAKNFVDSIEGTTLDINTKELCGGARIYYIYHDVLGHSLASIHPTANLSTSDIRTAIRNSTGPRPSLFVPELAFDLLVKPQIKLLESPAHRCVELVYEELMKICHNCGTPEFSRYPKLQQALIEVISELLRERLGPTISYVESLIEIHRSYINTNHPSFVGAAAAMASVVEDHQKAKQQSQLSQKSNLKSVKMDKANGTSQSAGDVDDSFDNDDSDDASDLTSQTTRINGPSSTLQAYNNKNESKDSFLNFFFGKDQQKAGGAGGNSISSSTTTTTTHVNGHARSESKVTRAFEELQLNPNPAHSMLQHHQQLVDPDQDIESELSEREMLECELIKRLITSYFGIVREMIQDQVPKAIMCLLVNYSKESVQNRLVTKLYKQELFNELLLEDENLAQDREKCVKLLDTYKEASKIISEVL
ncbi:Dynamin-related protein DNM1 [Cyberlindnera fabianii]|uniref:dynamin GTPase n=1 Tax=Cyberlindnera fabianii TaxID=36022 RepID=A0A1V2KYL6_CYBFA|nr:Dynamin-related protein DNM1 [Cyberlindnera fabianii]